jgi:hypothetical protein
MIGQCTRVTDTCVRLVPGNKWGSAKPGEVLQVRALPSGWEMTTRTRFLHPTFTTVKVPLRRVLGAVGQENRERVRAIHRDLIQSEEWRIERAIQRLNDRKDEARRERWKV